MLVLNTTSPPATPSAPAASPRKYVPSSRARIASTLIYSSSSLQRRRDTVCLGRTHLNGRRPRPIPVQRNPDGVRTDLDERKRQRRRAHLAAIEKHGRARRFRLDDEGRLGL